MTLRSAFLCHHIYGLHFSKHAKQSSTFWSGLKTKIVSFTSNMHNSCHKELPRVSYLFWLCC